MPAPTTTMRATYPLTSAWARFSSSGENGFATKALRPSRSASRSWASGPLPLVRIAPRSGRRLRSARNAASAPRGGTPTSRIATSKRAGSTENRRRAASRAQATRQPARSRSRVSSVSRISSSSTTSTLGAASDIGRMVLAGSLTNGEQKAKVRVSPMDESDYVELRCRSAFSFLEGASNPEDLAERAAQLGHPAVALADRAGLYGIPRVPQAARAAGVRALVGAEVALAGEERSLLLLVESRAGYRNLCRLLTLGQARAPKGECRASWDELEDHAGGLVALARGDGGLTLAHLDRARAVFPGRLWVGVSRSGERRGEVAVRLAGAHPRQRGVSI